MAIGRSNPAPSFAHVGRREVDGDGFVGIAESGIDERGLDALAALAHRHVGHTDRDEIARRARLVHVDFDIDQVSIDAVYGSAASLEQRHSGRVSTTEYSEGRIVILKIARRPGWSGGTGRRTGLKIPRPSLVMRVRPPPPAPGN